MKKTIGLIISCFFLCSSLLSTFSMPVYAKDESGEPASSEKPKVEALGAVLIDGETGRILWGKNEKQPMAMASTTKIMTAIIALENGNMNDIVTVSKRAAAAPDVQLNLKPGEKMELMQLMYALMLMSYNDAAIAIAEHVGGSVENFCVMMTSKAKELGALDTVFETPNGLDHGDHHSTAYDMALITNYALNNNKFKEIITTPSITIKSDKQTYDLVNRNRLLNEFAGAIGVKTGFTGKAGHCFVGAAKRDDMTLISVVLGSGWGNKGKEQKWVDTKSLLNYGFDNFRYQNIISQKDKAATVYIDRSKTPSVDVYFSEGLKLPLTKEEAENMTVELTLPESVLAPVFKEQPLGTAKILIGGRVYKEIPLLAGDEALRHDLKTSMEKLINCWFEMGTNNKVEVVLPEF